MDNFNNKPDNEERLPGGSIPDDNRQPNNGNNTPAGTKSDAWSGDAMYDHAQPYSEAHDYDSYDFSPNFYAESGDREIEAQIADEIGEYLESQFDSDAESGTPSRGKSRSHTRKSSEKQHTASVSITQIAFFALRIIAAITLFSIASLRTVPVATEHVLEIIAFVVCSLGTVFAYIRDIADRHPLTRNLSMLLITTATVCAGERLSAVITIMLFEIGAEIIKAYSQKQLQMVLQSVEKTLVEEGEQFNTQLSRTIHDIYAGKFNQLRNFRVSNRYYIWAVAAISIIIGLFPPLIGSASFADWVPRGAAAASAVAFSSLAGILIFMVLNMTGWLFAHRIYFSSSDTPHKMSQISSVIFNMTGVITEGKYKVTDVYPIRISEHELLYLAAYAEAYSDHPLARAIMESANINVNRSRISKHTEYPGLGSVVELSGQLIAAGNMELMRSVGVSAELEASDSTSVFVAVGKTFVGRIDCLDLIKPAAAEAVQKLKDTGVPNIALMTGNNAAMATKIGKAVGISEIYADYLPEDKLSRVKYILKTRLKDDKLAFITDDVQDNALLKASDVGFLFDTGASTSELAADGIDILVQSDDPRMVVDPITMFKHLFRQFNLYWLFSIVVNTLLVVLAIIGITGLWLTVLIEMVIQMLLCYIVYGGTVPIVKNQGE